MFGIENHHTYDCVFSAALIVFLSVCTYWMHENNCMFVSFTLCWTAGLMEHLLTSSPGKPMNLTTPLGERAVSRARPKVTEMKSVCGDGGGGGEREINRQTGDLLLIIFDYIFTHRLTKGRLGENEIKAECQPFFFFFKTKVTTSSIQHTHGNE